MATAGKNVKYEVKGNTLTITVDLSQDHGMSSSGKTHVVATTGGIAKIGDDLLLGLNVNRK
jgi:hypothetical protein